VTATLGSREGFVRHGSAGFWWRRDGCLLLEPDSEITSEVRELLRPTTPTGFSGGAGAGVAIG